MNETNNGNNGKIYSGPIQNISNKYKLNQITIIYKINIYANSIHLFGYDFLKRIWIIVFY